MRQLLIIFSNIIIVIAIVVGVVENVRIQHSLSVEIAEETFVNTTEVVSGIADNYLRDAQTVCNGWANYINARDLTMEEAVSYLRDTRAIQAISAHIIWQDTLQGMSITERVSEQGDYNVDYSDKLKHIFDDASIKNGIGITARYNDPMTGEYVISIYRRVHLLDAGGQKKDAILLRIVPISYLEEKWIFPSNYEDVSIALIKKDGEYILKPNSMKNDGFYSYVYSYNQGVIDSKELSDRVNSEKFGSFYGKNAAGQDCIWAFRGLTNEEDWCVVVSLPREKLDVGTIDWLVPEIIVFGLLLILLIDISYFLVLMHENRIAQKKLTEQAGELQQALNSERENKSIVQGISREYSSLWIVKIPDMKIELVQENSSGNENGFKEVVKKYISYTNVMQNYAEQYVYEGDRNNFLEVCDVSYIQQQIRQQTIFSVAYRRILDEKKVYYQLSFAATDTDTAFILGFRNINEVMEEKQKQADDLAVALAAAEHANRAKTLFLNSMSHDIRTPMNAIIGFTTLASSNIANQEQVKDYLSKISLSSEHLLSLINDVLDMSRIESGKVKVEEQEMHLPDLFHDLRVIIQTSINSKNLELYLDTVNVQHEDIIADKLRLNQIFLNIVGNAIKFTNSGGAISIRVIEKEGAPEGYASYEFRIKDNGIGMSEEFKEHIFESFTREETATVSGIEGSGLGMAITKNIIDIMGGTITVNSEVNVGTEFIVNLQFRIPEHSEVEKEVPELKGQRALVIDNDFHICASVSKMLKDLGMRSEWTTTGKEALFRTKLAMENNDEFQIFLIDWMMPDVNGVETVRRIRKVAGDEKTIIIMTAYDWSEIKEEATEAGVTAFCSKPIFMSEIKEILTTPAIGQQKKREEKKKNFAGKQILLVEDNELNQEIAVDLLQNAGFIVDVAGDGTEAVEKMKDESAEKYDAILMDIQMPRMDGYECTRQIRKLPDRKIAGIPIIAMTANAFEEDKKLAIEAGMNGYISKPVDVKKLFRILEDVLG